MGTPVLFGVDEGVAVITLNRPEVLNAVDGELRSQLIETLNSVNKNKDVKAVVITGSGSRAFCAGQDLEEAGKVTWQRLTPWLMSIRDMYQAARNLDKPCVAALNGVAAGAGFQLALCTDYRIVAEKTRLGQPEVKAGLASVVGTYLMTLHIGLGHNTELSLLGDLIDGRRAYEIGLVNKLSDQPLETAIETARRLSLLPSTALRVSKQRIRALTQPGFDDAVAAGIRAQLECYASEEPQVAIKKFMNAKKEKVRIPANVNAHSG